MVVWLLFNEYRERVEGVYTPAGKVDREEQIYSEALIRRSEHNNRLSLEIAELRDLRQPYIIEAEALLSKEVEAKQANNTGALKSIRKQRKILLKQAEHLTYDIKRREEKILASQRLTRSEVISTYCGDHWYWEEHYVEGPNA